MVFFVVVITLILKNERIKKNVKNKLFFKKISSELIKINYQGWIVVEQDIIPGMGNPIKYAKKNRKFLYSINL